MLPHTLLTADAQAELALFTDALERFCDAEIEPHYRAWEKAGIVPRELFLKMGDNGYLCADVPEEYGGSGANVHFSFAVIEVLARRGYGGLVGGLEVHSDIIPPYLLHCGTEAQRQHWLPRLVSGAAIAAIGMTEPGAGSDLKAIRTTAVRDGDEYVLNGRKWFASNALHQNCKVLIVMGKTDFNAATHRQQSMMVVPIDAPGVTILRNLPVFGYQDREGHGEITFEDVRVPAKDILAGEGEGFAISQARLGPGRHQAEQGRAAEPAGPQHQVVAARAGAHGRSSPSAVKYSSSEK